MRPSVIAEPIDRLREVLDVFYDRGLELVSRLNDTGDVTATIGNREVATARLRPDAPSSVYFYDAETGLRVDLLFDLPIHAASFAENATRMNVRHLGQA